MPHASCPPIGAVTNPEPPVPAATGSTLVCRLTLDEREPVIVLHHRDRLGNPLDTYSVPSQAAEVHIALPSGSIAEIDAPDILEHGQDEQVWLEEFARLLTPGGILRLRVPVDGLTGWLDALNLVRYLAEMTGLAPEPDEPRPMGWHRHYRPNDLARIVTGAGFAIVETARVNPGLLEIPHAAGLVVGQTLLKRPGTERTLFRLRQRFADIENAIPAGPLGTRITITARRTRIEHPATGPYDVVAREGIRRT